MNEMVKQKISKFVFVFNFGQIFSWVIIALTGGLWSICIQSLIMFMQMDQLLRMLNERSRISEPDKSIALERGLVDQKTLDAYPPEIKTTYYHLFNPDNLQIDLFTVLPFQKRKTKTPVCNKILQTYQSVYRCYDCSDHEGAILCSKCFEAGEHSGHRFSKIHSGGGNCDCGNPIAIDKRGFCRDHTGIPEIPQISEKQIKEFQYVISHLFCWMRLLEPLNRRSYQKLSSIIINYLNALNHESLIYNVMTDYLLTSPFIQGSQELLIDWLFRIKEERIIKNLCELYFKMFSFQKFKYNLTIAFVKAYNQISTFKDHGFHCLFIQLFANDSLVIDVCRNTKKVINPKKGHNTLKFLEDFNFICSIKNEAAIEFYRTYFAASPVVPFDYLDKIQTELEKGPGLHLVDMVMNFINEENLFYFTYESAFKKFHKERDLLISVIKGLFVKISNEYSYCKNRVILPYQRVLSMGLFCLCNGQIDELSLQFLNQTLGLPKEYLIDFIQLNYKRTIWCLHQFAETFTKRSYFDNYLPLYIRSGRTCSNYDYIFVKQMAVILMKAGISTRQALLEIVEEKLKCLSVEERNRYTVQELVSALISFTAILTEIVVSPIQEIIMSSELEIQTPHIRLMKKEFFCGLLRNIGPMNREELKSIQKYFVGSLDDEFLFETCDFDKTSKKYSIKNTGRPLLMAFYPSRLKISNNFSKRQLDRSLPSQLQKISQFSIFQCEKSMENILPIVLPSDFIRKIFNIIKLHKSEISEETIAKSIKEQIIKILLISKSSPYSELYNIAEQIFPQKDQQSEEQQEKQRLQKKEEMQRRKVEKMKILKMKQNKFLQKHEKDIHSAVKEEQEGTDSLCMICRNNDENKDVLCYLANYRESNVMNRKIGCPWLRNPIFISCQHTAHFKCCQQAFGQKQTFKCPLCKFSCNVMLPVPGYTNCESSVQMVNRIETIAQTYKAKIKKTLISEPKEQCAAFFDIFKCLTEQIGIIGLVDEAFYEKKYKKLNNILYHMLATVWDTLPQKDKNRIKEIKEQFLKYHFLQEEPQFMKQKSPKADKKQQNNNESEIMRAVQQCIINHIFATFEQNEKKVNTQLIFDTYSKTIHITDLKSIISKILWTVQNQDTEQRYTEGLEFSDEITRVKDLFKFYSPPETIRDLIEVRDGDKYPKCKNGHNICICCECIQAFCDDCKVLSNHSSQVHANNSIAFSLLNGQLICDIGFAKIRVPSLYENKIGAKWSPEKHLDGFVLESQEYDEMRKYLSLLSIGYYVQLKRPELIEYRHGLNIEFA